MNSKRCTQTLDDSIRCFAGRVLCEVYGRLTSLSADRAINSWCASHSSAQDADQDSYLVWENVPTQFISAEESSVFFQIHSSIGLIYLVATRGTAASAGRNTTLPSSSTTHPACWMNAVDHSTSGSARLQHGRIFNLRASSYFFKGPTQIKETPGTCQKICTKKCEANVNCLYRINNRIYVRNDRTICWFWS